MQQEKDSSEEFLNLPFKDLKKLLQKKKKENSRPVHRVSGGTRLLKKQGSLQHIENINTEEAMFRDAMKEVREIKEFRDIPLKQKKSSLAQKHRGTSPDNEALKSLKGLVTGRGAINLSDTQEYIEWIDRDYHEDIVRRLRKGQYSVRDCLDLHGATIEDADEEVKSFFAESIRRGYHCVKIIHGRGLRSANGPVLKQALVTWLLRRYRKHIIAFVTARQCDGGLGALYVLLKQK